jgi:ribonuclease HII
MYLAILDLQTKTDIHIKNLIIDGSLGGKYWKENHSQYNFNYIVKGDSKYYSIACASIIAKEYHDEYIRNLCNNTDLDEKYNLLNNMGYGTSKHIEGIKKYGKACIEKALLFLFMTTALKNERVFHFLMVYVNIIENHF